MNNGQETISTKYGTIEAQLKWLDRHNHPCLDAIRKSLQELDDLKRNQKVIIQGTVSMVRILDVVCQYYDVTPNQVLSEGRHKGKVNEAMQMAMYFCELHTTATPGEICSQFNRHHTIMSHVRGRVRDLMSAYPEFRRRVTDLEKQLFEITISRDVDETVGNTRITAKG